MVERRGLDEALGIEHGGTDDSREKPAESGRGGHFISLAAIGLVFGRDLTFGSAAKMGPGFFPTILSLLILGIGLLKGASAFIVEGPAIERPHWRPLTFVCAAMMIFGLAINYIGLAFSAALLTFIAAEARPGARWGEIAVLAAVLGVFSVLLFVYGLGQSMPAWWGE